MAKSMMNRIQVILYDDKKQILRVQDTNLDEPTNDDTIIQKAVDELILKLLVLYGEITKFVETKYYFNNKLIDFKITKNETV